MKRKINQIATVQTGVFAKVSLNPNGVYLQQSDFNDEGKLCKLLRASIEVKEANNKHILQAGDLLFACKGSKNQCIEVPAMEYNTVASSSFLVIRITNKEKVLPAYVAWFLNLPSIQKSLSQQAIGSSIMSIPKNVLGEIEIPIPSVEKQKQCLQLAELYKREQALYQAIIRKRSQLIESKIINNL